MKIVSLIIFIGLFSNFLGCEDDETQSQFESTGTITGHDLALCICCGGYIIEIDGEEGDYRIESLPEGSTIDLETASFPLDIKFNWHTDRICNGYEYIIVEEIEER